MTMRGRGSRATPIAVAPATVRKSYHVDRDPLELRNIAGRGSLRSEFLAMRAQVRQLFDPPPPDFDTPHLP